MCLAVPMQVLKVDQGNQIAVVNNFGAKLTVNISLINDICPGDYLMIHAGFAIAKIEPAAAEESLALWKEYLQYVDIK